MSDDTNRPDASNLTDTLSLATFTADESGGPGLRKLLVLEHGHRPVAHLGRLQVRAQNGIARAGITTIAQLIDFVDGDAAGASAHFGRKTFAELLGHLDDVARVGPTQTVFGQAKVPATAAELFDTYVGRLEAPRDAEMFRRRYEGDQTLQEIGDAQEPALTRERIRQIIDTNLALDRAAWGEAAVSILAPVEELVDTSGGLAPLGRCLELAGAPSPNHFEFVTQLAPQPPSLTLVTAGKGRVVSRLGFDETLALRMELRRDLDAALARNASLEEAQSVLREFGLRLPAALELELLRDFLLIEVNGAAAYPNKRRTNAIWVDTLRLCGGAVSAKEVAARVAREYPDEFASARNAAAHFCRNHEAFNMGKDRWAHADHVGVDRPTLQRLAQACLDAMPRREAASSVKNLLKRVAQTMHVPAGVNAYAVRDAMTRTGRVRGWRNSLDVAWLDLQGSRTSIAERIRLSAPELPQPFHLSELVAEVAALGAVAEESVLVQVHDAIDLLALGGGEYVVREKLFADEQAFLAEQARVAALVPHDRVVNSVELAALAKAGAPKPELYDDPRLAWAVAHRHPSLATRIRGALLWRATHATTTWEAFAREPAFDLTQTFKAGELRAWLLRVHAIDDEVLAQVLLQEALEAGQLERLGVGYYRRVAQP